MVEERCTFLKSTDVWKSNPFKLLFVLTHGKSVKTVGKLFQPILEDMAFDHLGQRVVLFIKPLNSTPQPK